MQRLLIWFLIIPLISLFLVSCNPKPREKQANSVPESSAINGSLGKLFFAKNKLKPGVVTLRSGLQFSIGKVGAGGHPELNDLVTIFYQGRYLDGTIFDNEHSQDHPITVRVADTIPAWQEALQLMQVGTVLILYAPADLAYGSQGLPGKVGPNQSLIYIIHLLSFKKP